MFDFFKAALPWLLMGLTLAIVCSVKFTPKSPSSTDSEKKTSSGDYMLEGMVMGMVIGMSIGAASGEAGTGLSMGMLVGMVVGMFLHK